MSVHQLNLEVTNATSVRNTDGARRGVFKVSMAMLEPENIGLIKGLFDGMVVIHTVASPFEDVVTYYATHDEFDPVSAGGRTPEYVVMVDRTEDETRFFYERVSQESMI